MKNKLIISLISILALAIIFTGSAFASSVDEIPYLVSEESSSSSSTALSDIASSTSSSSSSSSSSSTNTNSNKTQLPKTGENDTAIFVSIAAFAIIAIYAYKKVSDYKNI